MIKDLEFSLFDLVMGLSEAVDLVSPQLDSHHKRVTYIAWCIATELEIPLEKKRNLALAGALHDIGALSLRERLDALIFELEDAQQHSELGYALLSRFEPMAEAACIIRYHHVAWNNGAGQFYKGVEVPLESGILHLADRVAVLIQKDHDIFEQIPVIVETIYGRSGLLFIPQTVDAFMNLSQKDYFWMEATSPKIDSILGRRISFNSTDLTLDGLMALSKLFARIVDFRSQFTYTHSSGVAAVAEKLADLYGFSARECQFMRIAGYLHDLGKLAVPTELLEKPGPLTEDEYRVVKRHTYFTFRILDYIDALRDFNIWASYHHERLNGKGYPFGIGKDDFPLKARIMAVADVFTAITEDRPYRKGMDGKQALNVLQHMAERGQLDSSVVSLLSVYFDKINEVRMEAQRESGNEYIQFLAPVE